jgi:hypothetical protein
VTAVRHDCAVVACTTDYKWVIFRMLLLPLLMLWQPTVVGILEASTDIRSSVSVLFCHCV